MSPLDFYMSQATSQVNIFPNPALLDEFFFLRVTLKVNHDATLSLKTILYETDQRLASSRVEVRYDPDWLSNSTKPIYPIPLVRKAIFSMNNSKVKKPFTQNYLHSSFSRELVIYSTFAD